MCIQDLTMEQLRQLIEQLEEVGIDTEDVEEEIERRNEQ